ncbi:uncharacterized protein LOC130744110 [Lotus japonicus]|uniref:uncharacterized protein LOC130744110 n=1 Tax=Lotus japonicus TaxID=34305 RepID=UPI002585C38A|nr:uncharacterized protein LOC130744110 [Lotus japonicus]
MGKWSNGVWNWEFKWRRRLRGREVQWLEEMLGELRAGQHLEDEDPVFKQVWLTPVPSNTKAFIWRLLRDRVQTRENLCKRRVLARGVATMCPLCLQEEESSTHLFLRCAATSPIWYACSGWLGFRTGEAFESDQILELAQLRVWQWLRVKIDGFSYSLFEWKENPGVCILSL